MKNLLMSVLLLTLLSVSAPGYAQETCPGLVESAINSMAQFCEGTGRNQVCYGHNAVTADP